MDYYFRYKKYKSKYLELIGGNPFIDRVREVVDNFKEKCPEYNTNTCHCLAKEFLLFISGCDVTSDKWVGDEYNLSNLPTNNNEISFYFVTFGDHEYILATLENQGIIIQSFACEFINLDNWLEGTNLENISENGQSAIQNYGQYKPFNLEEYLSDFKKSYESTIKYHGGLFGGFGVPYIMSSPSPAIVKINSCNK